MEAVIEKECSALGGLFQTIISDMKGSYPVWEDFINKAGKLQSQLRTTVVAAAAFLDAFQKVADMATNTRGGTREIGSALTRMCMRHRSIESKLRQFSSALIDCLINPLQEQMEEWKKVANQLDKDHAKEYKKARQEIKKKSSDTLKLQKKAKKAEALGRGDIQPQLDSALQDVNDKYLLLEETEKQAVRKALIEERGRFCTFISMLRPVIEEEISMLGEITHLQTISDDLKSLTMDPHKLPSSSEQVILDLKGSDYSWSYQTPPSSPSTTMSRKSSVCSSLNSVNSSDSRSSGSHSHSPSSHYRYRSSNLPQQAPMRLSSVSSHDSGFMSQDAFQSKSPSPMPPEAPNQNSSSSASSEASETCQSVSECSSPTSVSSGSTMGAWASTDKLSNGFYHCSLSSDPSVASVGAGPFPHFPPVSRAWTRAPSALLPDYVHYYTIGPGMLPSSKIPSWKDWAKPGPYDQPMVNTLQRRKEKREADLNGGAQSGPPVPPEEAQRPRSMTVSAATRQGEEMEPCEELALALTRGLQLDTQRSSRDSLQCSSGYSTQTTTPCCSEDTIPSQGLPTTLGPVIVTPGVATIRRTPSTKPSVRRGTIGAGPIPIKTPVIPVKTPTVPDIPGGLPGALAGTEECPEQSPESPAAGDGGQSVPSMPSSSWSGQASVNPPPSSQKLGAADEQRPAVPESEGEESERDGASSLAPAGQPELDPGDLSPGDVPQGEDMLNAIRRGVKLKKTTTNDRSAPRIS
ncbi:protein MTSS 1 isoform X12 [Gallus gallus]|uniref:protein MTSS 1 isoform X12 n=1 Tax=Gallus gallus TaxID=9031 RepID=UPI000739F539|nr:protein MTSS 1 isoform X12 [Gallus gallus]XP_046766734.1 protein MTSS 1 isoform X12 [Gallus gallus]|eukprot:XP_015138586.1 metastasis suppressor protein 1 isoform X10 [Gallus gallus]